MTEDEEFWDKAFCHSHQEIIDKYGQEFYDKIKKTVETLDTRTQEEKLEAMRNFILYGSGGD